jgi:Family of unknown function (DUF6176)
VLVIKFSSVRPDELDRLRSWMGELMRRRNEVLETFEQETVRHEVAYLLEGRDGPILVYAIEAEDADRAGRVFQASTLPIDVEHKRVMEASLDGPAQAELLYECAAETNGENPASSST